MNPHRPPSEAAATPRNRVLPLRGGQGTHGSLEPPSEKTYEGVAAVYGERMAAAYLTLLVIQRAETFERLAGAVEDAIEKAPNLPWSQAVRLIKDLHNQRCMFDAIELAHERALDAISS